MYRLTATTTRPDTSAEFWLKASPPAYKALAQKAIADGVMLAFADSYSADGLTMTLSVDFPSKASFDAWKKDYDVAAYDFLVEKNKYEKQHQHVEVRAVAEV